MPGQAVRSWLSLRRSRSVDPAHDPELRGRLRNEDLIVRSDPGGIAFLGQDTNHLERDSPYLDRLADEYLGWGLAQQLREIVSKHGDAPASLNLTPASTLCS